MRSRLGLQTVSKAEQGANIGMVAGSQMFLAFTLVSSPGKWLFLSFDPGQAVALFGYCGLAFCVATTGLGWLIGKGIKNPAK